MFLVEVRPHYPRCQCVRTALQTLQRTLSPTVPAASALLLKRSTFTELHDTTYHLLRELQSRNSLYSSEKCLVLILIFSDVSGLLGVCVPETCVRLTQCSVDPTGQPAGRAGRRVPPRVALAGVHPVGLEQPGVPAQRLAEGTVLRSDHVAGTQPADPR